MQTFNEFKDGLGKQKLTLKQLEEYFPVHDMAIVSAERDGNKDNASNTSKLQGMLKSMAFAFSPARGGFVENKGSDDEVVIDGEHSFVIVDLEDNGNLKTTAIKLGTKFDQDSILFSAAGDKNGFLIGTTKRPDADPKFKAKLNLGKPRWGSKGTYYTKVKDGYFTFGS